MASSITSGNATNGLAISSDNTGALDIKTGTGAGTTAISISSTQVVTGTAGNLMLISGAAQNSTSGTSIDFTGIPSWVKRITVMFNGVSTNGTSIPQIQLGTSSGPETTGYTAISTLVTTTSNTTRGATATSGFIFTYSGAAVSAYSGAVVFALLSSNIWVCTGSLYDPPNVSNISMTGGKSLSGTLDRVRITTVNGTDTFDAGSINILYE